MDEMILVKPSKELQDSIWEYRQEYLDYGEKHINGSCGIAYYHKFDEWLDLVLSIEKEKRSRDYVHASTFFSLRKNDRRMIGSIQLRHSLTADLEKHGGHIGFGIRPSERKKGYGKQQLLLVFDIARQMKIPKVMISCDKDNIASSRTIIHCGGILTSENIYKDKKQLIYWVDLRRNVL